MLFPRIFALSEIAWSDPANKDWIDFLKRTEPQFSRLQKQGVNFRTPEPFITYADSLPSKPSTSISLYSPVKGVIHYSLDGTAKGADPAIYKKPIRIPQGRSVTVKAMVIGEKGYNSAWKQVYP
jgi:hexosaminidase